MGILHDVDQIFGERFGVGLLHELREHTFQRGLLVHAHQFFGRRVCQHGAVGKDDDTVAHLLHHFQHMRDVEDGLALAAEDDQQVFEEARGHSVESAERFVEEDEIWVMQQCRAQQYALLHALAVVVDG